MSSNHGPLWGGQQPATEGLHTAHKPTMHFLSPQLSLVGFTGKWHPLTPTRDQCENQ